MEPHFSRLSLMAKQLKYGDDDVDMIDSLPDPVLSHILSFLPTKEAIRTSIVCPRWRYLFTSLSTFDFDTRVPNMNVENFNNFVDKLLSSSNHGILECFRYKGCDYSRLHDWISATLRRGVKELVLKSGKPSVLPVNLFTSQSLVTLKFVMYGVIEVPANVLLPNLKTLHIKSFSFDYSDADSFNRLISNCLALEDLRLLLFYSPENITIHKLSLKTLVLSFREEIKRPSRDFNYVAEINAPNLVDFHYVDAMAEGYTLSSMSSLERARIEVCPYFGYNVEVAQAAQAAIHLLQAISNVQSLHLNMNHTEELFGTRSPESLFAFGNLIELKFVNPPGNWKGTLILEFLHCVPNLKKLTLDLYGPRDSQEGLESVPNKVPSCLLFHLKEINILKYQGRREMFEMVRYFLNHSRILEKLEIDPCYTYYLEEEILRLPRNSKNCEIG